MATCKFCGEDPVFFIQKEDGGWNRPLVLVPGKLFMVVDGALVTAPSVYRQHTCDPVAREEHRLAQLRAKFIVDPVQAEEAAYADQERLNLAAYYETPEGAREQAIVQQTRYENGVLALKVDCPKCRVATGEPCVTAAAAGGLWAKKPGEYLKGPHINRIHAAKGE